ncbi:MAG TPA: hypothetical protein VIM34_07125 [Burkholderiaceae bacterium]
MGQTESICMKLSPRIPPGRSNRKARAFSAEIAQLVLDGYGCKAIHEALTDAGLNVSKSTVQREVALLSRPVPPIARRMGAPPAPAPPDIDSLRAPDPDRTRPAELQPTGKDIAQAFLKGRITNPLFRRRH